MTKITGVIQAGGRSTRMGGEPKALLELAGKRIVERVVDALSTVLDDLLVVTNTPERYEFLRLPMVADRYPDGGSLGGIFTGLEAAGGGAAFTGARAGRRDRLMVRLRPALVVHYHEISLKRGNRPLFLRPLRRNVERALADTGPAAIEQLSGRVLVDLEGHPAPEGARDRVARIFGVTSVTLAYRALSTLDAMKALLGRLLEGRAFASFRITARRAFKTYPMTSVDLNRALGAFVLERVSTRVDLEHAEQVIHVEVLPAETYISLDRVEGPGGLPVGSSGTVAALLSGGIDSPVAAWRMMKRGCRVLFVHFHSVPYLPATSQAKARALVERLTAWQ